MYVVYNIHNDASLRRKPKMDPIWKFIFINIREVACRFLLLNIRTAREACRSLFSSTLVSTMKLKDFDLCY